MRFERILLGDGSETLLELRYGPAARLWRINLGWRRRKEPTVYGFTIDANTGEWTKDSQAPTDAEDDAVREGKTVQRITPFVEDTRNVLVVEPPPGLSDAAMVSLQYALKRGIEQEFQLEEAELAAEPLPDVSDRTAILFYEAAEGGAGVLTRLASDPRAVAVVARRALQVCHFSSTSGDWSGVDDLRDHDEDCEAGCYRCLLSYYNQPEHPQIDRRHEEMLDLLCRLTHVTQPMRTQRQGDSLDELLNASTSSLEAAWLDFLKDRGHRLPDRAQPYLPEYATRPDFAYSSSQTLVYIDGPVHAHVLRERADAEIDARLEDAGYTVIRFGPDSSTWEAVLATFAWVFGTASNPRPDVSD